MTIKEKLKNPPKEYRPIPFWSWNEKLDTAETARQAEIMAEIGMGGYFMHARGGLETEYMGKEWFDNVTVGVDEAKKRGMGGWAYDENGWPSGFGAGSVNGLGEEYQQKYLRIEKGEKNTPHTIGNADGYHIYYDVNPFYVDNLDKKVVAKFIENAYKPYCEKYKDRMPGIFTDEPQLSRNGIPWSLILPEEFEKEYGYELIPHIPELFYNIHDFKTTRFHFWKLVEKLFVNSFARQIYEFLDSYGMKLTGHMVLEDGLFSQLTSNSAVMPNYEYFHIPGMDWLSRKKVEPLTPLQLASVANQLGKKQVLTESFALCGHNVSFEELRWLLEAQFVRGVNLLCPHLEGYSLRGIRKRDYPPAMYYQQPWWQEYGSFIEQMTRIGVLLTDGKPEFDTLLIHPQSTAWTLFDQRCGESAINDEIIALNKQLNNAIEKLERKHILFHLGDEYIMEKHARVEGSKLIIGTQSYSKIVMIADEILFDSTRRLLKEFKENGGIIISADDIPENKVCDNPAVTYTCRRFDDFDMHYFVNETKEAQHLKICKGSKYLDIKTGDIKPFAGECTLAPMSSIVVIDDGASAAASQEIENKSTLKLSGEWTLDKSSLNSLVLDKCDYWFDGELMEKNAYVLDIGDRANRLEKKVHIKQRYTFNAEYLPEELYLACETPDIFSIKVNGNEIDKKDCGYFRDSAFRMLDISKYVKEGENEIITECDFVQSAAVYKAIKDSRIFESEKNKLRYDMEIEGMFIVGDFAVKTADKFLPLDKNAYRYGGDFVISKKPNTISLKNIEQQGFVFFSGNITVSKTFTVDSADLKLSLKKYGLNAIHVKVNGKEAGYLIWNPYELDISEYLVKGENKIELTLVNNLRNLLGPHHLEDGECFAVGPAQFYKNDGPFYFPNIKWNDDYCFVETSLEF